MNACSITPVTMDVTRYQDQIESDSQKIESASKVCSSDNSSLIPNNHTLFDLKISPMEFKRIIDFSSKVPQLCRPCVFKRNKTGLPFSIACIREGDKISTSILLKKHRIPQLAAGTFSAITLAWNIESKSKEVFRSVDRSYVSDYEIEINKCLAGRKEFVATARIFEYDGPVSEREPYERSLGLPQARSLEQKSCFNSISKTIGNKEIASKIGFLLEYLSCSLTTYLESYNLSTNEFLFIFRGVLKNISVLHNEFNIAHCDIKMENILVKDDSVMEIETKIADFGHARFIGEMLTGYLIPGPLKSQDLINVRHLPPEVISSHNQKTGKISYVADPANDMWRFGVMLMETVMLLQLEDDDNTFGKWLDLVGLMFKPEFKTPEAREILIKEFFLELDEAWVIKSSGDKSHKYEWILPLIQGCLEIDPAKRFTANEAIKLLDKFSKEFNNLHHDLNLLQVKQSDPGPSQKASHKDLI